MSENIPKITIGIPVYNGEKFIRKRLDNILSQTFQDFEILIYDNSIDITPEICKEYALRDKRIQYVHEKDRSGWIQGWINVMKKAKYKYFILASVDDLWSLNFLYENINELEQNTSAVASIGIVEYMHINKEDNENKSSSSSSSPPINRISKTCNNIQQKVFRHSFKSFLEAKGTFEKKAEKILRNTWYIHHSGVVRTDVLKKSIIEKDMFLWDWPLVLNFIKYGDLHMTKTSQYLIYDGDSTSRQGIFRLFESQKIRINEYFFPASTFSFWCIRNVGLKFFIKNLDYFIWLNFIHIVGILLAIDHKIRK